MGYATFFKTKKKVNPISIDTTSLNFVFYALLFDSDIDVGY